MLVCETQNSIAAEKRCRTIEGKNNVCPSTQSRRFLLMFLARGQAASQMV